VTEPRSTSLERRGGAPGAASPSGRRASRRRFSARAAAAGGLVAVALAVAAVAGASAAAAIRLGELQVSSDATVAARADMTKPASNVAATTHPTCPAGQIAQVQFAAHPVATTRGAATPEAALRIAYPSVSVFTMDPLSTTIPNAPVWIVADNRTFEATILPDGSWFASPVTFVGCHVPQSGPRRVPAPGSGPVG